jgi:hypothetical protein
MAVAVSGALALATAAKGAGASRPPSSDAARCADAEDRVMAMTSRPVHTLERKRVDVDGFTRRRSLVRTTVGLQVDEALALPWAGFEVWAVAA